MRYLHKFEDIEEFEEQYFGSGYTEPWTSLTEEDGRVKYNKCQCEWVDLGFSSGNLWARWNLGAMDETEEGDAYAWGELETKSEYYLDNYKFYDETLPGSDSQRITKYNSNDGLTTLETCDDVVKSIACKGGWCIPTYEDFEELMYGTEKVYETRNGVDGVACYSMTNGNSIFFPSTNKCWSSTLCTGIILYAFFFGFCGEVVTIGDTLRNEGLAIRPVYKNGGSNNTRGAKKNRNSNVLDRSDNPTVIDGNRFYLVEFLKKEDSKDKGDEK